MLPDASVWLPYAEVNFIFRSGIKNLAAGELGAGGGDAPVGGGGGCWHFSSSAKGCRNLDSSMRVKQIRWVNLKIGPNPDKYRFSVVILVKISMTMVGFIVDLMFEVMVIVWRYYWGFWCFDCLIVWVFFLSVFMFKLVWRWFVWMLDLMLDVMLDG